MKVERSKHLEEVIVEEPDIVASSKNAVDDEPAAENSPEMSAKGSNLPSPKGSKEHISAEEKDIESIKES